MPSFFKTVLCASVLSALVSVPTAYGQDHVTVYAAASLTNAIGDIAASYEAEHDVRVSVSYASSSTLAKQIEAGAPAQVFISADTQWMDYLQTRGKIDIATRHNLLGNHLVLISPKDSPVSVSLRKGFDLSSAFVGKLCTGDTATVPAGIYAKEALINLGMWSGVEKRVVGTDDVRAALAFVARGECPVGIVYETDAKISDKVVIDARFPDDTHKPVVYPVTLLPEASRAAQDFYQYLGSDHARKIYEKYGFVSLQP